MIVRSAVRALLYNLLNWKFFSAILKIQYKIITSNQFLPKFALNKTIYILFVMISVFYCHIGATSISDIALVYYQSCVLACKHYLT